MVESRQPANEPTSVPAHMNAGAQQPVRIWSRDGVSGGQATSRYEPSIKVAAAECSPATGALLTDDLASASCCQAVLMWLGSGMQAVLPVPAVSHNPAKPRGTHASYSKSDVALVS